MRRIEKILTLLLMATVATLFSACSDDKDEPQDLSIVGTWSYVVTDNGFGGLYGKNEVGITYTFTNKGEATCKIWEYKNGKKVSDDVFHFSYKFDGKNLTLKDKQGNSVTYSVVITGNKLMMNDLTFTKK